MLVDFCSNAAHTKIKKVKVYSIDQCQQSYTETSHSEIIDSVTHETIIIIEEPC